MDIEKIKSKCRKAFIPVTGNRIFGYGAGQESVKVYCDVEVAKKELKANFWENPSTKVVAFYLVPASLIEKNDT